MSYLKSTSTKLSLLSLCAFLCFTACQKESIQEVEAVKENGELQELLRQYPSEVTMDNWEEFVYAPQAVIDHFQQTERSNTIASNPSSATAVEERAGTTNGLVQAFNGFWKSFPGVTVIAPSPCFIITTTNGSSNSNYSLNGCTSGISCMNYTTSANNGLSSFDLVLTKRHILGLNYFTDARQFLAADVNRNGIVTTADMVQMRKVILAFTSSFPASDNIVFVPNDDFADVQSTVGPNGTVNNNLLQAVGTINNCLSVTNRNRRAIKTGDVSGNFNF